MPAKDTYKYRPVVKITEENVPYFNAPIFLENKSQVGKIYEIFGTLMDYFVPVKLKLILNLSLCQMYDPFKVDIVYASCRKFTYGLQ